MARNVLIGGNGGRGGASGGFSASGGDGGSAGNATGGGVHSSSSAINGCIITAATICSNSVTGGSGGAGGAGFPIGSAGLNGQVSGGGIYASAGSPRLLNTLIALNGASDAGGAFASQGHNLIGKTNGSTGWLVSDLKGSTITPLDPLLGPLQDNGGATPTAALLPGSAAINAGDDSVLATVTTDQRDYPRRDGAHVDIGAFESQPLYTLTINSGSGVVLKRPDQRAYPANSIVTLVAAPMVGFNFTSWSGHASGAQNPAVVTMTGNKSVTANFSAAVSPIIIDNPQAEFVPAASWTSRAGNSSYLNSYRDTPATGSGATATFTPDIVVPGYYDLHVWYPIFAEGTPTAHYSLYNGSTSLSTTIDQRTGGGRWVATGLRHVLARSAGKNHARITDIGGGKSVMADAVRFVFNSAVETRPVLASVVKLPDAVILRWDTPLPLRGFAVRNFKANFAVTNLAAAQAVITTPSQRTAVYAENRDVINYLNGGGGAHYSGDNPFPGFATSVDENDFVIEATGSITIPASGDWTFGVNSDDGFKLTVGNFSVQCDCLRGPADSLATFSFPSAGDYPIRLVFFERAVGAEVELFAALGAFAAWNATNFRLVGDTAAGGLSVRSVLADNSVARSYRVQYKSSVSPSAPWSNLPGDVTTTGSVAQKVDTSIGTAALRFYRLMQMP